MKINSYLFSSFIFVVTFCVFVPFSVRGIDPHHDGLMLKTAMDVLSGQILFKETFTQYGSLTIYLQALLLYLFGAKLIVLKIGTVVFYSMTAVVQFAIGRKYLPLKLNILAYIFWILIAPFYHEGWVFLSWSSSFALFFQSLSILFFMNHIDSTHSKQQLFYCGIFAAATFWCRIPVGTTLLAAYIIIFISGLILRKKRPQLISEKIDILIGNFKYFALGSCLIFLLFFSILFSTQSISDWYFQVLEAPQKWLNSSFGLSTDRILWSLFYSPTNGVLLTLALIISLVSYPFVKRNFSNLSDWTFKIIFTFIIIFCILGLVTLNNSALDIFGGWSSAIPLVLLGFFLFISYRLLFSQKLITEKQIILVWLTIISVASWHQYFPVTCYRHIFWAITPALGPFLMICLYLTDQNIPKVMIVIGAFLAPMSIDRINIGHKNLSLPYIKIDAPYILSEMYAPKAMFENITLIDQTMKKYLAEKPNAPVLLDGGDALYNVFAKNLINPEPMFVNWGYSDANSVLKRARFIKEWRPIIITENRSSEIVHNYEKTYNYKSQLITDSIEILIPIESASF